MTPDTVPRGQSAAALESEANIYDDHANYLLAKELRRRAAELREEETSKCDTQSDVGSVTKS